MLTRLLIDKGNEAMDNKLFEQSISRLNMDDYLVNILAQNNITTLGQLSSKSKKQIKSFGIEQGVVNKIEIELELLGMCFKNSL